MTRQIDFANEQGLLRRLSPGQQAMMAIGGAIGTGLFLGSGLAVGTAGPAVILSYVVGAAVAMLLAGALTEMTVAHPTAGSFGVYADRYVTPFAGYAVRISYWLMQVIATGGHMVAIAVYMRYWFPDVPGAVWIVGFSLALTWVNARDVGTLGTFEYWFAMIKVVALVGFIVLGLGALAGWIGSEAVGWRHYSADGGFAPRGLSGIWLGVSFVIYSYIGVEIVAVTSGEAADPERTIPAAMRRMVVGLCTIYVTAVAVLVGVMPWTQVGVGESPFVRVLRTAGLPAAAGLMNFVVLSAALSSANANLYIMTRTLFSLARARFVPQQLGALTRTGVPLNAILASSTGLLGAVVLQTFWPDSAYVWFFGVALFGGLFVWLMVFVTHLAFRRTWDRHAGRPLPVRVPCARACSLVGLLTVGALLVTTWWTPGLRVTVLAGVPWILLLWVGFRLTRRVATRAAAAPAPDQGM